MWKTIGDWITNIVNYITNVYNTIVQNITNVWNNVVNYVTNVYNTIANYITNVYNTIANYITNVYNTVNNYVSNVYNTTVNNITQVIGVTIAEVAGFVSGVGNSIKAWAEGLFVKTANVWNTITGNLDSWWKTQLAKINETFGWVNLSRDNIETFFPNPLDWLWERFTDWFLGKE